MAAKKIDVYLDICSLFSFVAFEDLLGSLPALIAHGVQVEFHPVLLGAINKASGNRPPWTLEAKARYLRHDSRRAADRVGLAGLQPPKDLMAWSHTVSPLRALHFIKARHGDAALIPALRALFRRFWMPGSVNVCEDANLRQTLLEARDTHTDGRLFSPDEVDAIMAGREGMRDALRETTERALRLGAFGAPWIVARNARGDEEPFFGSDRFNHVFRFLEVPFCDVAVLAKL